jgi:hypothetical protein
MSILHIVGESATQFLPHHFYKLNTTFTPTTRRLVPIFLFHFATSVSWFLFVLLPIFHTTEC